MVKKPSKPIPDNQYERFKSKLEEISSPRHRERNLTLFMLDIATGYRLQDLVDLTIKDIREALLNEQFIIQEKKQLNLYLAYTERYPEKPRIAPEKREHDIESPLETILKKYIKGKKNSEYAFPSQKGDHISAKSYSAILTRVAKELNIKNISGHSLRKSYATGLYEAKKDMEFVRIALGHGSIEVTKKYIGIESNIRKDAAKIAARNL